MEDEAVVHDSSTPVLPEQLITSSSEQRDDVDMPDSLGNPRDGRADFSDSDDSGDSDGEAQQILQIETLESELSVNPYNYDAYVEYIKLLRKMGELEKLRQAREAMSGIYPLSPSMWQEWAKDEASLSSGANNVPEIEKLYERGLYDYQSASLWCDYLNFLQESDPSISQCSPEGISKARSLFERAISAAGLHITEGSKIWEAYREFEQAIFLTIDENKIEEKEKQIQRIRSIFHRQLSVPLANLGSTLLAYKAWEMEQGIKLDAGSDDLSGISPNVATAYKKASEMYNARVQLEEQISRKDLSDSEKFQEFLSYIKFEQTSGDPARVQAIYERAVAKFPVSSDLWMDYTLYLDQTLKVGKVIRDVYSRSTRSCPWSGQLWVRYLLALERGHASEEEISAAYEKSLQCTFYNFEEYLELYLTRVDGLRRRMSTDGGALNYSIIRETFQQATDYLMPLMQSADSLLRLHAYWAHLEVNMGKDLTAARSVWESLLKKSGSELAVWQSYIDMEVHLGNIKEARSLYRRCYTRRFDGTGSEDICHRWLQFEREHGTLEDFDHAVQKATPRLEELQTFKLQQESKDLKEHKPQRSVREKRKPKPNVYGEPPAKRPKNKGQTVEEAEAGATNVTELSKEENMKARVGKDGHSNEEQRKSSKPVKPKVFTDECTAFISNLNLKAHEEDIRKFFSDVGGVVSIRILHHKDTAKSRGLAYVDFVDDEHLTSAIAKNRTMLLGKKISVARSNPTKGRKGHARRGGPEQYDQAATVKETRAGNSIEVPCTSEESKEPKKGESMDKKRGDDVKLKRKSTFLVPRNVRPLGVTAVKHKADETEEGNPKSNEEFRKMFLKK